MIICDNYRAVTLLFTTYKILASVLYLKLVPHAEEITGALRRFSKRKINCWSNFLLWDKYWKNVGYKMYMYII